MFSKKIATWKDSMFNVQLVTTVTGFVLEYLEITKMIVELAILALDLATQGLKGNMTTNYTQHKDTSLVRFALNSSGNPRPRRELLIDIIGGRGSDPGGCLNKEVAEVCGKPLHTLHLVP